MTSSAERGVIQAITPGTDEELLSNPGFETGSFDPWYHDGAWVISDSLPHTGTYCAYDIGNHWVRQDITPTPQSDIASATLWMRQPEAAISAIDFFYSNMNYSEDLIFLTASWAEYNVTHFIRAGGIVTAIRIWGYMGGGPDPDETFLDDVSIQTIYSPDLIVTLTPINPPVVIPAGGGSFAYTAQVENVTNSPIQFDAWTKALLPNGASYGPIILRQGLNIPGGGTISRQLTQFVPGNAPYGNYYYIGYAGTYPNTIVDSDSFAVQKLAGDANPNHNLGWAVHGWFDEETMGVADSPQSAAYSGKTADCRRVQGLCDTFGASPNPFNPSTVLSFELRDAGFVELAVYDISGREVAALVEGFHPAGAYEVVFNASNLPSGVYFARLTAGDYSQTQKILLAK